MWRRDVQAVTDRVRSFHSSRQSLSHSTIDRSGHEIGVDVGSGRGLHQYEPSAEIKPVREESQEVLTRMNTVSDEVTQPSQQQQQQQPITADVDRAEQPEYLIRRTTLGELFQYLTDVSAMPMRAERATDFKAQQPSKLDEEVPYPGGRSHTGTRSTMTTEFSRNFQFVDAAETDSGVEDGFRMHSAWSEEEIKHLESRADNVLVDTLPASSSAEHQLQEPQDEAELLEQGAIDLTRDAFIVTIQRVSGTEPVPLPQAAIRAAEVITLDILNRDPCGDLSQLESSCSASKCGPDHIKLASAIVRRLLESASGRGTKWSKKALQAASLLVEDVLTSSLVYVNCESDVAKPDHVWSREAIQMSCLIVRDVMGDAARQASTAQRTTAERQEISQSRLHGADSQDLVDLEFAADQHDIEPPPTVPQTTAGTVVDDNDAVRQVSSAKLSTTPGQQQSSQEGRVDAELAADQHIIEQQPAQPTASRPASQVPSECNCCYDQDSVFSDSKSPSEFML